MGLSIRVADDWEGADRADVEAVAQSVFRSFDIDLSDCELSIVLEQTRSVDDPPIALIPPSPFDPVVVRLNVQGMLWARLAYQFAHELVHVLAGLDSWRLGRFAWFEETIAETASLYSLRATARSWVERPPYPNWAEYAPHLGAYAAERMAEPAHFRPPEPALADWLSARLADLEADLGRRSEFTIVAKELLPVFEACQGSWSAVRFLHTPGEDADSLGEFLARWARQCPPPVRNVPRLLGMVLLPT